MTLKFVADENFNNNIIHALLRYKPDMDIVPVQDVGLSATDDRRILEWAAHQQRILLTHDVNTVIKYADKDVSPIGYQNWIWAGAGKSGLSWAYVIMISKARVEL